MQMTSASRAPAVLVAVAVAAVSGCACDSVPSDAIEDCSAQVAPGAVATDILFVIDDSVSMGDEQTLLRDGLYAFIETLDASPIANDIRVGVTNTSVLGFDETAASYASYTGGPSTGVPYPQGALVAIRKDASGAPLAGDLYYDLDSGAFVGPRILDGGVDGMVADFQANVLVGVSGSAREQPFAAARLALEQSAPGGANEGFLRPGARLAIIFLSDEDDCSGPTDPAITFESCRSQKMPGSPLVPVSEFASFLAGPLAGELREVVVAAIVGVDPTTLEPSCGQTHCALRTCSTAIDQGDRFVELLAAVGPARTRLASICDASFDAALADFASVIMSKTLPLEGAPADWRMLVARIERPGVGTIGCTILPSDDPAATTADAIYDPPRPGRPASLTFQEQNRCALEAGDRVDVNVVCVR
jgi:hypothetical protein